MSKGRCAALKSVFHLLDPGWRSLAPLACLVDQAQIPGGRLGLPSLPHGSKRVGEGLKGARLVTGQHGQFEQGGVVPVVGLSGAQPPLDGIRNDGNEPLPARIRRIAQLHQCDRIDARVSVAPVRLEAVEIRLDGPVKQAAGEKGFSSLDGLLPSVLVHTP